jgi:hypothetical protein
VELDLEPVRVGERVGVGRRRVHVVGAERKRSRAFWHVELRDEERSERCEALGERCHERVDLGL